MSKVPGCKRKLKTTTITEKYKILKEVKKGESSASISKKYGVPKQTLSGWLKEKRKIYSKVQKNKTLGIDTLVDFSMFSQSGEIGIIALKAANLFERVLCESMKQTFISDFFQKKLLFDMAILYRILYVLIFLLIQNVRCV